MAFKPCERLVVAASLKVMRELRIDWRRQCRRKPFNPFGDVFQPIKMSGWVALIVFAIADHRKSITKRCRERGLHIVLHELKGRSQAFLTFFVAVLPASDES